MDGDESQPRSAAKCGLCLIVALVIVAVGLVLVLVPLSYKGLQYYELGFRKRSTTGVVDTNRTYSGGLHFIGPDYTFKIFKADAHFVTFRKARVFAADRLQVYITANLQYFLRKEQLAMLHKAFDIKYERIVENNALDAIKGAATVFTTREFIRSRGKVEKALFQAVKDRLGGICCEKDCQKRNCRPGCKPYKRCLQADAGLFVEVRFLQLHELDIPNELNQRYLQSLILQESTVTAQLNQDAFIKRRNTVAEAQKIENEAREINQNATSISALVTAKAKAEAEAIVEKARSSGLGHLYRELGLTTTEDKVAFEYLRTVRTQSLAHLAIDYQTYASISNALPRTRG